MRSGNAFGRVCLFVCASVCPVRALTFESLDTETSFLVRSTSLEHLGQAEYQGHVSRSRSW